MPETKLNPTKLTQYYVNKWEAEVRLNGIQTSNPTQANHIKLCNRFRTISKTVFTYDYYVEKNFL